jgi:hypothetical protein
MLICINFPLLLLLGDEGIPLLLPSFLLSLLLLLLLGGKRPFEPGLPPACDPSLFLARAPLMRA